MQRRNGHTAKSYLLSAAVALMPAARLKAQAASGPAIGERVQLETRTGARVVGIVAVLGPDTVRLRGSWPGATTTLPLAEIVGYRSSLGRDQRRGARTGALAGAVAGAALLAAALYADATTDADLIIPTTVIAAPVAAGLVLLGAGIGAASVPERWTDRAPLRVSRAPSRTGQPGAGLGFVVRF